MMATVWPVPSRQAQATLTAQGCASRGPPYASWSPTPPPSGMLRLIENLADLIDALGSGAERCRARWCARRRGPSRAETWWTGTPAWSK
jgi:hypothetical protein